jgi:hypothetical protein
MQAPACKLLVMCCMTKPDIKVPLYGRASGVEHLNSAVEKHMTPPMVLSLKFDSHAFDVKFGESQVGCE